MPSRHGAHDRNRGGNYGPDAAIYLAGQTGYTDLLAQAGWTCGISGKWHLGNSVLPQHGFSQWFVHEKEGGEYNDAPMIRDGELFNGPGYVTNVITDDALAFIDRHVGDAAPFYLSVHYTAPHSPWTGYPPGDRRQLRRLSVRLLPAGGAAPVGQLAHRQLPCQPRHAQGLFAAVTAMDLDVGAVPGQPSGASRKDRRPPRCAAPSTFPRPYTTGGRAAPSPASWRAPPHRRATAS